MNTKITYKTLYTNGNLGFEYTCYACKKCAKWIRKTTKADFKFQKQGRYGSTLDKLIMTEEPTEHPCLEYCINCMNHDC